MDKRYRIFVYFLGILILGSLLLDWLSGKVKIPEPARIEDASAIQPPPVTPPPAGPQTPPDAAAGYVPPYAPSYENPSIADEETSKVREAPSTERQPAPGIANSSDLQPPAPAPTLPPDEQEGTDQQYTTSPKSSNAALRETLKPKGR